MPGSVCCHLVYMGSCTSFHHPTPASRAPPFPSSSLVTLEHTTHHIVAHTAPFHILLSMWHMTQRHDMTPACDLLWPHTTRPHIIDTPLNHTRTHTTPYHTHTPTPTCTPTPHPSTPHYITLHQTCKHVFLDSGDLILLY